MKKKVSLFLLSIVSIVFIVSIGMISLFQLVAATRLFLKKIVFPISPFYTEENLSSEQERLLVLERKENNFVTNFNI